MRNIVEKRFKTALESIRYGCLQLTGPDGKCEYFHGGEPGPQANLHIEDWSVIRDLAFRGEVGFAEAYRNGLWDSTDMESLFRFSMRNEVHLSQFIRGSLLSRFIEQIGYFTRINSIRGSRRNIHDHYDLGNAFYQLWLDPTMTYSSALYKNDGEQLENAQQNKYDRLLDRIEGSNGSILEIGCGWGGFAERALQRQNGCITGLTLSTEQLNYARNRLQGQAEFKLMDYRHAHGLYDNIVSIEMFEAVGISYWKQYFSQVKNLLKRGGKALIQSIVIEDERFDDYRKGSDVIRSYIFPGGMLPSNERFCSEARKGGLKVMDQFEFGKDYGTTLHEWYNRFESALPDVRRLGFDESFIRIWRYYLTSCAAAFMEGRISVMQYELQHD